MFQVGIAEESVGGLQLTFVVMTGLHRVVLVGILGALQLFGLGVQGSVCGQVVDQVARDRY
jgi:hypothetical protein